MNVELARLPIHGQYRSRKKKTVPCRFIATRPGVHSRVRDQVGIMETSTATKPYHHRCATSPATSGSSSVAYL